MTIRSIFLLSQLLFSISAYAQSCADQPDPISMLRCEMSQQSRGKVITPASNLLKCRVNVDCNSKADSVNKMRSAWRQLRTAGGMAGAYASVCFDAFRTIESIHPRISISAEIVEPQLVACNAGLLELNR